MTEEERKTAIESMAKVYVELCLSESFPNWERIEQRETAVIEPVIHILRSMHKTFGILSGALLHSYIAYPKGLRWKSASEDERTIYENAAKVINEIIAEEVESYSAWEAKERAKLREQTR